MTIRLVSPKDFDFAKLSAGNKRIKYSFNHTQSSIDSYVSDGSRIKGDVLLYDDGGRLLLKNLAEKVDPDKFSTPFVGVTFSVPVKARDKLDGVYLETFIKMGIGGYYGFNLSKVFFAKSKDPKYSFSWRGDEYSYSEYGRTSINDICSAILNAYNPKAQVYVKDKQVSAIYVKSNNTIKNAKPYIKQNGQIKAL